MDWADGLFDCINNEGNINDTDYVNNIDSINDVDNINNIVIVK